MAEKEKVTLRIESYDNDNDNEILIQGPVQVWKSVESVSDLLLIDVREKIEDEDENWVVYVKNVNDPADEVANHRYRGAYFKYNKDYQNWQEILLGTHSHENKAILDQISNVDTENLPDGEKKVLVIERNNSDGNIKTEYNISWQDVPKGLPALPEVEKDAYKYLTTDSDGNLTWSNTFIPSESFSTKKLTVTKKSQSITLENVVYKTSDELFVFVGKNVLTDYKLDYNGDKLTITLINDYFDIGEKVNVLILKSGIQAVIDQIELNLKQELISQLSGGSVSLKDYYNKTESAQVFALKQHTHSQFAKKDHDHDWKYANFQHNHAEYITREQVYGILAAAADEDGDINFDSAINNIEKTLTSLVTSYKTEIKIYVQDELKTVREERSNSDNIVVTSNNTSLTDYLEYLKQSIKDIENIKSSEVILNSGIVQIGEGNSIGGLNNGDRIPSTLAGLLDKILKKRIPPKLVEPELKITVKQVNARNVDEFEYGSQVTIKVTPEFIQNDAGRIISFNLTRSDNTEQVVQITNKEEFEINNIILGNDIEFTLTVNYEEGPYHSDNLGLNNYSIKQGKLEYKFKPKVERYIFMGTSKNEADLIDYRNDDDIYIIRESTFLNFIKSTLRFNHEEGIKSLLFAFPIKQENTLDIETIDYVNQGVDMTDLFIETTEVIPGAGSDTGIEYKVYKYEFYNNPSEDIKLKVELR